MPSLLPHILANLYFCVWYSDGMNNKYYKFVLNLYLINTRVFTEQAMMCYYAN